MVAQIFTGQLAHPGYFRAQCFPFLIEPPHQPRQPGNAAFHQYHLKIGEALKDSFRQQADQMGLESERKTGVPLDIMGGITGRGLHVDAHAVGAGVDRKGQVVLGAHLVDRVVLALTKGGTRTRIGHHLDKVGVTGPAFDLFGRGQRILVGNGDRPLEDPIMVILTQLGISQPVVVTGGDGGAQVRIGVQIAEGARQ